MRRRIPWILGLVGLIIVGSLGFLSWFVLLASAGALIILFVLFALLVWYVLAPSNRFFTFVNEGTVKIVVKGDAFSKCLIQWKGKALDREWNVIDESDTRREPLHLFGGLRLYGFWPLWDIFIYHFRWTGVSQGGKPVSKDEWLDYIILKDDVYWCEVADCEDSNLLPLSLELLLTARVVNPYKALFKIQDWLETIINRMKPFIRGYMGGSDYKTLISERQRLGSTLLQQLEEQHSLLSQFREDYGIDIRKAEVKEINPPEDFREKTLAPYFAGLDKEATVIRAEAEAARIDRVFEQIQKFGDLGRLIRTLEAAEKSPLAASLTVQAIPGLSEMLRGAFGKPFDNITQEELRMLREAIEKLGKR